MPITISSHPDLIVERERNGWTVVRLNRPKSLHALDEALAKALRETFTKLASDAETQAIWFDSTTPKAFCAGGDVRKLRQLIISDEAAKAHQFFAEEYALDLQLHQYAKPVVVWGDGYVMGGGMGLFMASAFRLVTPQSRLAMPEINIGLYPDVGGTRFLAERGPIGLFLGMTGSLLTATGAHAIGWATHHCEASREEVLQRLTSIQWSDYPAGIFRAIADTLDTLHRPMTPGPLLESLDLIHSVCRGVDFMQDYESIIGLKDARSDWLRLAAENLSKGSPSTAALTWLLWQWGKSAPAWSQVFELEKTLAEWKTLHPDFSEGVRARLVDKDLEPSWQAKSFNSLKEALGSIPAVNNQSWMDLLAKYGVTA